MKSARRAAGLVSGLVAASALALVGATPASAAATWVLVDHPDFPQRICVHPERGWPSTYFHLPISGYWDTTIYGEVRNLPPGSYSDGGAVHPGDWDEDRQEFVGLVHVSIAPTPVGEYIAELWASDGTDTQTVPVVISVKEDCLGD
ncbi:DUF5980 family protein [Streptomyces sp. MP131-18]|uniref:DUF5980 family protein n=1 Tax=Streptomyces sp. MP131-18 TaxID=1857892 RepID=UPI00097BC73A|nr:DUF5980 family protein [Streptomyces sp. MP131-18]ONK13780.1 hypothetical protein STBA_45530 [Streptomyces sp. MP131-18]